MKSKAKKPVMKGKMGRGMPAMHGQQPMADVALGPYGRKRKSKAGAAKR